MGSGMFDGLPLSSPLTPAQTLVFYMPFRHILAIAQQLVQQGMPPQTPALCVSWLSYPQQTLVAAPLTQIGEAATASTLEAPTVMVVGDVVGWWQQFHQQDSGLEPL
jgi:siroheme synthase